MHISSSAAWSPADVGAGTAVSVPHPPGKGAGVLSAGQPRAVINKAAAICRCLFPTQQSTEQPKATRRKLRFVSLRSGDLFQEKFEVCKCM